MSTIPHTQKTATPPLAPLGDAGVDAGVDAGSERPSDGSAIFITARLADYGRLADRLAILATTAHIVTLRHPDDINAAALLRDLLALALDAHRASVAQDLRQDLHYVDLRGREVDAADWHELERLRDTSDALRHIVARLTQQTYTQPLPLASASAPETTSEAQQTARERRPTVHPSAPLVAPVATSSAPTHNRKGHAHV